VLSHRFLADQLVLENGDLLLINSIKVETARLLLVHSAVGVELASLD